MCRRSPNSERARARRLGAIALTLALALPSAALAAPAQPLVMDPQYAERERDEPARAAPGCAVTIAALTDERRSPETIGMLPGIRAIAAPADRAAWLRSVIEIGLTARGFTTTYAPAPAESPAALSQEPAAQGQEPAAQSQEIAAVDPAPVDNGPDVLTVRIDLHSVWLGTQGMNKTGSVVLQMSAAHGTQMREGYYRGEHVAANWANGRGEFNEHLDRTFAEALDAMANDLRPMCAAS